LAESPRPLSDTKKLASPLVSLYRILEFDPSSLQGRSLNDAMPKRPIKVVICGI